MLAQQNRDCWRRAGPSKLFQSRGSVARRPNSRAEVAGKGVPSDRRGDKLQAAHPQDPRVLPRRSAQLRRAWDAQPSGVRPGLLRQEWGRLRGHQAHRPPLQDASICTCAPSRAARGSVQRAADHRYLQHAAGTRRVLLCAAVRAVGSRAMGAEPRCEPRRARTGARDNGAPSGARVCRYSLEAPSHRALAPTAPAYLCCRRNRSRSGVALRRIGALTPGRFGSLALAAAVKILEANDVLFAKRETTKKLVQAYIASLKGGRRALSPQAALTSHSDTGTLIS